MKQTPEQLADALIALGPDACLYFEHCFPKLFRHPPESCPFCASALLNNKATKRTGG